MCLLKVNYFTKEISNKRENLHQYTKENQQKLNNCQESNHLQVIFCRKKKEIVPEIALIRAPRKCLNMSILLSGGKKPNSERVSVNWINAHSFI